MLRQYDIPSVDPTFQESQADPSQQYYHYYASFISEESVSRDRAAAAIAEYLEAYRSFAVAVIHEIAREMPGQVQRYALVVTTAWGELNALRSNLKVKTLKEAEQIEAVVSGLLSYIAAAEYLEDRAAMLGHAMGEIKATLEMLNLVRQSANSAVWAQTAQASPQVGSSSENVTAKQSPAITIGSEAPDDRVQRKVA